jgi:glycosyltransferase involved in cell wall biosynthesis
MQLICLADGPLLAETRKLGIEATLLPLPQRITNLGESGLKGNKLIQMLSLGTRLAAASPAALAYAKQFRRAIQDASPDIIHSNGVKSHLLTRTLPRNSGKIVWHIHDLLGGRALLSKVLHRAAGRVAGAIAISQAVATDLKTVLPRTPVFPILNAIDTNHYSPATEAPLTPGQSVPAPPRILAAQSRTIDLDQLSALPPAPPETVRVGLVATYARWKGQDIFQNAIAKLPASMPPARFYIIGGSIYHTAGSQFSREELQARATTLGIADKLGFIGFQSDPLAIYRALDVMVHASSKPEPFGRTIIEAMSCGKAVIISNAGGAAELFTQGVDALGVAPGDADGMANAIEKLVTNPSLRNSIAQAARTTALTRFGLDRFGREFLAAYQKILSANPTK